MYLCLSIYLYISPRVGPHLSYPNKCFLYSRHREYLLKTLHIYAIDKLFFSFSFQLFNNETMKKGSGMFPLMAEIYYLGHKVDVRKTQDLL